MSTILDPTPAGLADAIDALAQGLLDRDREVAGVLIAARERLRAIGWSRYAATVNRASRARALRRRHAMRRLAPVK